MAKKKVDAVIEAVRYTSEGKVAWVRLYERRGPTFSDWMLVDRDQLLGRLKAGKKIYTGKRVEYLASTFDLGYPVSVAQRNGADVVISGESAANRDHLEGAPVV
jgi:hypothetical protein